MEDGALAEGVNELDGGEHAAEDEGRADAFPGQRERGRLPDCARHLEAIAHVVRHDDVDLEDVGPGETLGAAKSSDTRGSRERARTDGEEIAHEGPSGSRDGRAIVAVTMHGFRRAPSPSAAPPRLIRSRKEDAD
ncbi:MAG: hypothetical protein QM820_64530 [Minicystis sp.]